MITQKQVWDAKRKYPESSKALDGWYRIMKKSHYGNFSALRQTFNSVDKVGRFYIFNIGGNKLRLITNIHFNRQKVYIRHMLTHQEYDKGNWKE